MSTGAKKTKGETTTLSKDPKKAKDETTTLSKERKKAKRKTTTPPREAKKAKTKVTDEVTEPPANEATEGEKTKDEVTEEAKKEENLTPLFDLQDFRIFDEIGVVRQKILKNGDLRTEWTAKGRVSQPKVGDPVGIFTHMFFGTFQIQAIGFVARKYGREYNPSYDVEITEIDPNKWTYKSFEFRMVPNEQPDVKLGLNTGMECSRLVFYNRVMFEINTLDFAVKTSCHPLRRNQKILSQILFGSENGGLQRKLR